MQATLFDPPPALPHRQHDPLPSKQAARSLDLATSKQQVLDALRFRVVASDAHEIQHTLAGYGIRMDVGAIRSRLNQLREDGLVRKVGIKATPPPLGSGRSSTTWALT